MNLRRESPDQPTTTCVGPRQSRVSDSFRSGSPRRLPSLDGGMRVAFSACVDANTPLRFVEARQLETPVGSLTDAVLISRSNKTLGKLDGVIIHPLQRRVCYYVVKSGWGFRTHRRLLEASPAALESRRGVVRIDAEPEDLTDLSEIAPQSFPPFSDEDVIDAMFAERP